LGVRGDLPLQRGSQEGQEPLRQFSTKYGTPSPGEPLQCIVRWFSSARANTKDWSQAVKVVFWHFYTFRLLRGIETLIIGLANALVRRGIDVSIVTAKPTLMERLAPLDTRIKIYAYPTTRYYAHLCIVPFYVAHFAHHRYDHIVVFFADFGEGLTWRLLNKFVEMPLVLYLHYPYSGSPHRYRSFLRLGWDQMAKHILGCAAWIAQEAGELFRRQVQVVPQGTDPERFRPDRALRSALRQQLNLTDREVILLNVSALEERKGIQRVIQAIARIRRRFPHIRYLILGEGKDELRLKNMVEELHLEDVVIFGGITSQPEAYFNLGDIFVLLSDLEAYSLACDEAMSSGLPVLVSRTAGFLERVTPEVGFLVDPNNAEEIDAALTKLIVDPLLRCRMGEAGRARILANHTWDRAAEQYLELLR